MLSPVESWVVPSLLPPPEISAAHSAISGNGSCKSNWFDRRLESVPLASASISWPAWSVAVVLPFTVTVPTKTQMRLVPSARTRTSNCVPRTAAFTEWPATVNDAPELRCCTLVKVRPTFSSTETDCTFPCLCSCTPVTWTVVAGASRTKEPSGNWMEPCPPAPAATVSPALSDWPGMPTFPFTVRGWLITINVAGAVTAADAWTTKNHQPPPAASTTARINTTRQPPQPKPQPRPPQPERRGAAGGACGCIGATGGAGGGCTAIAAEL